ncbi:MAG TPA: GspH/FimT family pseudopilin [Humisphaera sp.]
MARPQSTRRRPPGRGRAPGAYTLIEVVLVLAIAAVVAGVAVPRFGNATARYRADTAARRICADLAQAQAYAKYTGSTQTVTFAPTAKTYQVSGVSDLSRSGRTYQVDLADAPYRATAVSASFGGSAAVSFDAYGNPSPASTGTVTVRVGTVTRTVTMDATSGRATWQ